jgi:ABC-2 type transport system permease protein
MIGLLEIYHAQLKVTFAVFIQYRAELLIWLLGAILQPVVYLIVWATVARANGGAVGGYSASGFAAYYIAMMLVDHLTFTWIMYEFEPRIREGQFSPRLVRPIHPIHSDIADNVTHKLLGLVPLVPVAVGLTLLFHPTLAPQPWAVAAFIPALLLACVLRFAAEWTLALAAFWVTRVGAINQLYEVVSVVLSGYMAPLSLFPAPVQALAAIAPFRWAVAFPVELVLGRVAPRDALIGLGVQAVWAAVAIILLRLTWRAAVRRYAAVGA